MSDWATIYVSFLIQIVIGFLGLFFVASHIYRVFRR